MNSDGGLFNPDKGGLLDVVLDPDNRGLFDPDNRSLVHPSPLLKPHHVWPRCLWPAKLHHCRGRMLDRRAPVDDRGSVNQARGLGLHHCCWWVLMVNHQRGLLNRLFDLHLVVVLLHIVVEIQSHHMGPGCLRCHRRINHGCFWHRKSWRHHHPWSLVHQPTSLLVNHLMQLDMQDCSQKISVFPHLDTVWPEHRGRLLVARVLL